MSRSNPKLSFLDDDKGYEYIFTEGRLPYKHISYRLSRFFRTYGNLERLTKPSCRGDARQHEFKAHHIKFEYRMCLGCVKKANAKNILLIFKHITYEQKSISFFNPFNYFT